MHIHYFSLLKIAEILRKRLQNACFIEAFTQQKDELVLGLAGPEDELYLRVNCAPPTPFVWPVDRYPKAKKNVLNLLTELEGKEIRNIYAVAWERQLVIELEGDHKIVLKMHGNQSNVLWLQGDSVKFLFRNAYDADADFELKSGELNEVALEAGPADGDLKSWLRSVSMTLDRNFLKRLEAENEGMAPSEHLRALMREAQDETVFLLKEKERLKFLLLRPADSDNYIRVEGFDKGLSTYLRSHFQFRTYAKLFSQASANLQKELKKLRGKKGSYEKSIFTLLESRDPEEIGHIIMANLHALKQGMEKVELEDYYQGGTITIKLRPEITPQKNAEIWYRKQKNRKGSLAKLEKELAATEQALGAVEAVWETFEDFPEPATIALTENGFPTDLLRDMQQWAKDNSDWLNPSKKKKSAPAFNFWEFRRDGFLILAGRNAKNNDQLSFSFSKKDDLWLHAKDATGSHVIIRNDGRQVPPKVLEFAAGIAAGLSRRKGEGLVPVIHTPRKFIRKPRDGRPGQVLVDREEILLVEPLDADAIYQQQNA